MKKILFSIFVTSFMLISFTVAEAKIAYRGGNGSSYAQAIIIQGAKGEMDGVQAEYQWLRQNRPGWQVEMQGLQNKGRKYYDILDIRKGRASDEIYFDITGFYGKFPGAPKKH